MARTANHTSEETKGSIRCAFKELYKENHSDKISVSSICKAANINRGTFYYYYNDIYDLMSEMENDLIDGLKKIYPYLIDEMLNKDFSNIEIISELFEYYKDLIILFSDKIENEKIRDEIKKVFMDCLSEKLNFSSTDSIEKRNGIIEYFISGQIGVITWWIKNEKPISINDLFKIIHEINNKGAFTLLQSDINDINV